MADPLIIGELPEDEQQRILMAVVSELENPDGQFRQRLFIELFARRKNRPYTSEPALGDRVSGVQVVRPDGHVETILGEESHAGGS
jgi:hypothetical protein